ncbi:MAG: DUF4430 domain-containing protein [Candidatus Zixiibacteriota bacterium]
MTFLRYYLMLVLIAVSIIIGCGQEDKDGARSDTRDTLGTAAATDSIVFEMPGADSVTVFELLRQSHEVQFVQTAAGVFVKSIDSIENSATHFWIYSVDDTVAMVAADDYITSDSDIVRWHYRKMSP